MLANFDGFHLGEDSSDQPKWVWVPGKPIQQGSVDQYGGKIVAVKAPLKKWRETVAACVRASLPHPSELLYPRGVPVGLELLFVMPRPLDTPKRKPTPPAVKKPDLDKLVRAVGDALSGLLYWDDAQVKPWIADKRLAELGEQPGLYLRHFTPAPATPGPPEGVIIMPPAAITSTAAAAARAPRPRRASSARVREARVGSVRVRARR